MTYKISVALGGMSPGNPLSAEHVSNLREGPCGDLEQVPVQVTHMWCVVPCHGLGSVVGSASGVTQHGADRHWSSWSATCNSLPRNDGFDLTGFRMPCVCRQVSICFRSNWKRP